MAPISPTPELPFQPIPVWLFRCLQGDGPARFLSSPRADLAISAKWPQSLFRPGVGFPLRLPRGLRDRLQASNVFSKLLGYLVDVDRVGREVKGRFRRLYAVVQTSASLGSTY